MSASRSDEAQTRTSPNPSDAEPHQDGSSHEQDGAATDSDSRTRSASPTKGSAAVSDVDPALSEMIGEMGDGPALSERDVQLSRDGRVRGLRRPLLGSCPCPRRHSS